MNKAHKIRIYPNKEQQIQIVRTFGCVRFYWNFLIEDLNVKGLLQNHNLAKPINDASWFEFTQQLQYKAKWKGRTVIKVDRFFPSSQICSNCGHKDGKKELKIREWVCPECGAYLDRDVNAAINILNEGLKLV